MVSSTFRLTIITDWATSQTNGWTHVTNIWEYDLTLDIWTIITKDIWKRDELVSVPVTLQLSVRQLANSRSVIGTFIEVLKSGSDTLLCGIDRGPVSFNFSADADGPKGAVGLLGLGPKREPPRWSWRVTGSTAGASWTCSWPVGCGGPPIISWIRLSSILKIPRTSFPGAKFAELPPWKKRAEETHTTVWVKQLISPFSLRTGGQSQK